MGLFDLDLFVSKLQLYVSNISFSSIKRFVSKLNCLLMLVELVVPLCISFEVVFLVRLGTSSFPARHEVLNEFPKYLVLCWERARSQLCMRFSMSFPYTSCLAGNELEPSLTKNVAFDCVNFCTNPNRRIIFTVNLFQLKIKNNY